LPEDKAAAAAGVGKECERELTAEDMFVRLRLGGEKRRLEEEQATKTGGNGGSLSRDCIMIMAGTTQALTLPLLRVACRGLLPLPVKKRLGKHVVFPFRPTF